MAEITPCEWLMHWENDYEVWRTGCDRAFEYMTGGPVENDYQFCPGCGKRIVTPVLNRQNNE